MKFLYNALTKNDSGPTHSHIWKEKIPPKIKMFLWLIEKKANLTKDNMLKRKLVGSPTCHFCNQNESTNHLFLKNRWAIVARCTGTINRPSNLLSGEKNLYIGSSNDLLAYLKN